MWKFLRRNSLFITLSILLHGLLIFALFFGLASKPELPKPPGAGEPKNVIKAVAVDAATIDNEKNRLQLAEQERIRQEQERQKQLEEKARKAELLREQEQKKLAELKKQQAEQQEIIRQQKLAEEKRIEELKQKKLAEEARIKKLKQDAEALEKKKLAEEKKRKEEEAQRAEKARLEAERKKLEEERKKQAAIEAKKKAEEKARQEKLRVAQEKREQALREQLAAEEKAEEERELQGVRLRYIDSIAAVVKANWRRPPVLAEDASCQVVVTQIPGGEIIGYRVSRCSGGAAFQQSVETALGKTSHLPEPPDPRVFDRQVRFTFTPK